MQLRRIPNTLLALTIQCIRPMLGPGACRFTIGCTSYALFQLETESFFIACYKICKRLCFCAIPYLD